MLCVILSVILGFNCVICVVRGGVTVSVFADYEVIGVDEPRCVRILLCPRGPPCDDGDNDAIDSPSSAGGVSDGWLIVMGLWNDDLVWATIACEIGGEIGVDGIKAGGRVTVFVILVRFVSAASLLAKLPANALLQTTK